MEQGRTQSRARSLLACLIGTLLLTGGVAPAHAAKARSSHPAAATGTASRAKARTATRQFTGWITAIDQSSLTVEKRGKKPRQVTFSKHPEMKTTGELEKDARVTVYYRDEGGRLVATRVVVKPARTGSSAKPSRPAPGESGSDDER